MEKENKNKIWIGKDGIIYVETIKVINEKEILKLLEKIKETMKIVSPFPRILIINLVKNSILRSYEVRRRLGKKLKEMTFEKGAIYEENIFSRIVALFIIMASGIKNVKVFKKKKEALKWLKKD